ncbi:MAG: FAD-binding oxidoreductase [Sulfolobales archaeon]|nr:FAD-binding oxidoreductase [Sulfolobales archaeon]
MSNFEINELKKLLGHEKVLTEVEDLYVYGYDSSIIYSGTPWAVVRAYSTEDVAKILKFADEHSIPVIPRGGGSSLTGGPVPLDGGIILDLRPMNKVKVNVDDGVVEAEAGATIDEVDKECRKYGFMFPIDPASSEVATVGGTLANDGGGMRGARYGTMRNALLSTEVVLPGGKVLNLGSPVYKQALGYELAQLIAGSEGTLGIITKAVFKIVPLPEKLGRILAFFNDVEDAARAIFTIRRRGLNPLVLEFLDDITLQAVDKVYKLGLPQAAAAVLADVDGPSESIERLINTFKKIFVEHNSFKVDVATDPKEMDRIYVARKGAYPALSRLYPVVIIGDICVPISKLPKMVRAVKDISKKYDIPIAAVGHAGDGNLHTFTGLHTTSGDEWERGYEANDELSLIAIELGGSASAEHGIGMQKKKLLERELILRSGDEVIKIMKEIKRIFDPKGIMNPGKLFD